MSVATDQRCFANGAQAQCYSLDGKQANSKMGVEQPKEKGTGGKQGEGSRSWALKPGLFFFEMPHKENERVVRARAGMLNIVASTAVCLLMTSLSQELADAAMKDKWQSLSQRMPIVVVCVMLDFVLASLFGMAACPTGIMGTILSVHVLKQPPIWKPSRPMRFSWFLGFLMTCICITIFLAVPNRFVRKPILIGVAGSCCVLTYLEASLGFCAGCWMFRTYFSLRSKATGTAPAVSC